MSEGDLIDGAVRVLGNQSQVLARSEGLETLDVDLVVGSDLVVVSGVGEGQSEHALLLQVGLVDTSEGAGDDGETTKVTGFKSSVFTRRALAVVVVSDDNPLDAVVAVVGSGLRNTSPFASDLVLDLVRFLVGDVDGADEAVLGDVLKVSTVLEPRATSGDVVSGALAENLDQDGEVMRLLAVPWLEGLEELKTVRSGADNDIDRSTVLRWGLEGILSRVIATRRKLVAGGILELEGLAISASEGVGQGVEGQVASESHGGDDVRGSDEGVGGRVGVVTASEVTVVGGDD